MADRNPGQQKAYKVVNRCLGQWNSYVEAGETKDLQLERLKEVPDYYRKDVIRHMRTVVALADKTK